ncbi:hypothetical protein WG66_008028 [Moniliophthora roreri]|nr:hypothetical protein WG66_008028 [Moniliophthora roreri]
MTAKLRVAINKTRRRSQYKESHEEYWPKVATSATLAIRSFITEDISLSVVSHTNEGAHEHECGRTNWTQIPEERQCDRPSDKHNQDVHPRPFGVNNG